MEESPRRESRPGDGAGLEKVSSMNVAQFLDDIAYDLGRAGIAASQLDTLEFAEGGRDINVKVCKAPREPYPTLEDILDQIGRQCLGERITAEQLRCITFFQERADIEFIASSGEARIQSCAVERSILEQLTLNV
jgi:hypothetical protein